MPHAFVSHGLLIEVCPSCNTEGYRVTHSHSCKKSLTPPKPLSQEYLFLIIISTLCIDHL